MPASKEEIREAARQYVRKVSGFGTPSSRHQEAFESAVDEVAAASRPSNTTTIRARVEETQSSIFTSSSCSRRSSLA